MTEHRSPDSLPADRVQEILDASEHTDVPAGRLLGTAQTIRSTLLDDTPHNPHVIPYDRHPARVGAASGAAPARHRGRAAVLVGTIAATTMLAMAGAGALPGSMQSGVARGAAVFGIHLPDADDTVADSEDSADRESTPAGSNGSSNRDNASDKSGAKSGTNAGATGTPVKASDASTATTDTDTDTEGANSGDSQANAGGNPDNAGKHVGPNGDNESSNGSDNANAGNGNANGPGNANVGNGNANDPPGEKPDDKPDDKPDRVKKP